MKQGKYNRGFSSVEVLATLLVLLILLIGFSYALNFQKLRIARYKNIEKAKYQIQLCFNDFMEEFKKNINSECDGPNDSIYQYVPNAKYKCKLQLKPLSGLVDINYLPNEFYEKSYFLSLLKENVDSSFIQTNREKGKLITSYIDVSEFISEEAFNTNITLYSLININTVDQNVFTILCELSDCMTDIVSKRKILLKNRQYIHNETEAILFFGFDYERLKPYITTEAPININFADKEFLKSLLSLERFKLNNYQQKCDLLDSERNNRTLDREYLCNVLGISKNDELYYYLGCRTYFWELIIDSSNLSCKYILFNNEGKVYLLKKQWV